MLTIPLLFTLFLVGISYLWRKATVVPDGFPPGLPKWPLFGSLFHLLRRDKVDPFLALAKSHGPVVGFFFRGFPSVLLSDVKMVREVFKLDVFSNRNLFKPYNEILFGGEDGEARGLSHSNGAEWREQRRFSLRNLRDLGLGKASMNDLILDEISRLFSFLKKEEGKPFCPINKLNISILGSLWTVLTGETIDLEDKRLEAIIEEMDKTRKSQTQVLAFTGFLGIPWLTRLIDPLYKSFKQSAKLIFEVTDDAIQKHESTLDPDNPRDFLDIYLREISNCQDEKSSFFGQKGRDNLKASYVDLITAGQETTASSINWSLLYLLKFPEVMRRVQTELDEVVGRERMVTMDDEENLPYLKAFILESMRMASLAPQAVFHVTAEDTTLNGYKLPKGTNVLSNLIYMHHDPSFWKDPEEFRPERFLNGADWKDHLLPFGTGKRICLGQTLAEKEYFLYLANMVAKYKMESVSGETLPSIALEDNPTTALIRLPPKFRVVLSPRK